MNPIAESLRRLGLIDGLLYLLSRVLSRLTLGRLRVVRYYLVAQPVPVGASIRSLPAGQLEIVPVAPGDALVAQFPRPPAVVARRYADGAVCLAARTADRFAGFLWLSLGPYEEDEVRCRYVTLPKACTAWDFDVYVDPAFRMGRTFVRLWDAANVLLREHGVAWTLSRISAFNAGSLHAHERFGTQRLASATFLCAGGVQLTIASTRPFVHVALTTTSRPELRLHVPAVEAPVLNSHERSIDRRS
jgi:hypothetical protein